MSRDQYAPLTQRSPVPIPKDSQEIPGFLEGELGRIWSAIQSLASGHLSKTDVEPPKPRDGDIRYADGTNWNPGAGEGAYIFYNSTWNKMG